MLPTSAACLYRIAHQRGSFNLAKSRCKTRCLERIARWGRHIHGKEFVHQCEVLEKAFSRGQTRGNGYLIVRAAHQQRNAAKVLLANARRLPGVYLEFIFYSREAPNMQSGHSQGPRVFLPCAATEMWFTPGPCAGFSFLSLLFSGLLGTSCFVPKGPYFRVRAFDSCRDGNRANESAPFDERSHFMFGQFWGFGLSLNEVRVTIRIQHGKNFITRVKWMHPPFG